MQSGNPVTAAVEDGLAALGHNPPVIAIALSGGRDSLVLLHALAQAMPVDTGTPARRLRALHVHHGLSPHATAWAQHCADACARMGVPLEVLPVSVAQGPQVSVEAAARAARYAALARAARDQGATWVALAHHQDDQAETVLLQLLRGAGPHGLAAMPGTRFAGGIHWWRPLLNVSGGAIARYADDHDLRFVDDESNRAARFARSALRMKVMPELARIEPSGAKALARAAAHQAEAALLLNELAAQDAGADAGLPTLSRTRLIELPPHRARNLLRWFLRQCGLRTPPPARLREMLRQIAVERPDANVEIRHDDAVLGVHDGRLVIHAQVPPSFALTWRGEAEVTLPHGIVRFGQTTGTGIAVRSLQAQAVVIRSRQGGERLQIAPDRPRRTLKALLRELRMPVWERQGLPLLFCGDQLAWVPGIGIAAHCQAAPAEIGFAVTWRPFNAGSPDRG